MIGNVAIVQITAMVCPVCGVHYGLDAAMYERRAREGGNWYCTNGHRLAFIEPEIDKLKKQLASAQGNLAFYKDYGDRKAAEARDLSNQVRAQKAAKTRLKRRATNGVCLSCHRHFANVERHMRSQHPDQIVTADAAVEFSDG